MKQGHYEVVVVRPDGRTNILGFARLENARGFAEEISAKGPFQVTLFKVVNGERTQLELGARA